MAIMGVLSELHAVPDLKLNLKFEIEVLCKHLSMEIGDVTATNLLNDVERAKNLCQLSNPKGNGIPVVMHSISLAVYQITLLPYVAACNADTAVQTINESWCWVGFNDNSGNIIKCCHNYHIA